MNRTLLSLVSVVTLLGAPVLAWGDSFLLSPDGSFQSLPFETPNAINNLGQIVGTIAGASFLDSGGVLTSIAVPGSFLTVASGINDTGQIVGSYRAGSDPGTEGFLLANGLYTTINIPGSLSTSVSSINNSGQIAGTYNDADRDHGFVLSGSLVSTVNVPGTNNVQTRIFGMNNSGQIVGTYYTLLSVSPSVGVLHGFLDSNGVFTTIDFPGVTYQGTFAYGINDTNQIVGAARACSSSATGFDVPCAFSETNGIFTAIDVPTISSVNNYEVAAFGINDSGSIIVVSGPLILTPEPAGEGILGLAVVLLAFVTRHSVEPKRRRRSGMKFSLSASQPA